MRVEEALKEANLRLKPLCENPSRVAKILLMSYLDVSIEWIFLNQKSEFDESGYFALVKRFENYEPLEYINGKAGFYEAPKIAEIGTGSGIISVMLALKTNAKIVATDINEKALKLAKKNALKFNVSEKIDFVKCSYIDEVLGDIDILVSNPPYIARGYKLDKFVINEPHEALFGGEVGDEILKNIILIARNRSIKNIACEMGYDQRASMEMALKFNGFKSTFYKDLAGFDRGFCARLKL